MTEKEGLSEQEKRLASILEIVGPIEVVEIEEKDFRAFLKKRKEVE